MGMLIAGEFALDPNAAEYPTPERVANFVRRVIRGEKFYAGPERRESLRYPITMPVKVTALDENREVVGESFLAVTRDISIGGMCFYHTEAVKQKFLRLEMTSPSRERLVVLLEVARTRPAGPFFEVAGRFAAR